MEISLTPDLEDQVRLKVESGLYDSPSAVVTESLRLMLERDLIQKRLIDELSVGLEQLQRGEGIMIHGKDEFIALAKSK